MLSRISRSILQIMNDIDQLLAKKKNIISIYMTAGYPNITSTKLVIQSLEKNRADLIEIGLPYSDPLADGPTIQKSSQIAIENGVDISLIFSQLEDIKQEIHLPLILMGYYNQFLKFGQEVFLRRCKKAGISGLIFPDLPPEIYQKKYQNLFKKYGIHFILLASPKSSDTRILQLSKISKGFLYLVSSTSTTGAKEYFGEQELLFFQRVHNLKLDIPTLIGFGIANKQSFNVACRYAQGGIIGSAFIQALQEHDLLGSIQNFMDSILT